MLHELFLLITDTIEHFTEWQHVDGCNQRKLWLFHNVHQPVIKLQWHLEDFMGKHDRVAQ